MPNQVYWSIVAVQRGQAPTDFKPTPTVGSGVEEIRIRTEDAYRIFYVARFEEAVYVFPQAFVLIALGAAPSPPPVF